MVTVYYTRVFPKKKLKVPQTNLIFPKISKFSFLSFVFFCLLAFLFLIFSKNLSQEKRKHEATMKKIESSRTIKIKIKWNLVT